MREYKSSFDRRVYMRTSNDCYTACLATVLNLPYESVPRLFDDEDNELPGWRSAVSDLLTPLGLQIVSVNANETLLQALRGLYITSGPSYSDRYKGTGVFHAVVYLNGELYHDPKIKPSGVIVPEEVDLLVSIQRGA